MTKSLSNQVYFDLCCRFEAASQKIMQSEAILSLICGDTRMQEKNLHDIFFSLWALGDLLNSLRDCVDEADHEFETLEPDDFLEWLKTMGENHDR